MKTHEETIRPLQRHITHSPKSGTSQTKPYSEAFKTAGTGLEGHGTFRGWCPMHKDESAPITPDMLANAFLNGLLLFLAAYVFGALVGVALG